MSAEIDAPVPGDTASALSSPMGISAGFLICWSNTLSLLRKTGRRMCERSSGASCNAHKPPPHQARVTVLAVHSYQVGATPSKTELPKNHCDRMKAYKEADAPLSLCPPERDVKWRFFWRVGERPTDTKYAELNAEPVVPAAFPTWASTMDGWGAKLLGAGQDIAKMAATGFGLAPDAFTSLMHQGPHLQAPTASDFNKFSAPGTVLAGFHYDLNFITVHGKSRFPGLFIWTRSGKKLRVVVPDGCLLMQAGKQMEFLTGGHVKAGFHEVVVVSQTSAAIQAAKDAARSLWRISSTCFTHIASDVTLQPLGDFATPEAVEAYPATSTGDQVNAELASINLGAGSTGSA